MRHSRTLTKRLWRDERGAASAVLEMMLVVGLLILPMLGGLAQVPRWIDAVSTADLAAQEAARQMVLADDYTTGEDAAFVMVRQIVANHGFDAGTLVGLAFALEPAFPSDTLTRGRTITATVTLRIDPIFVPGVGPVGSPVVFSRSASERVDDYREL